MLHAEASIGYNQLSNGGYTDREAVIDCVSHIGKLNKSSAEYGSSKGAYFMFYNSSGLRLNVSTLSIKVTNI